MIPLNVFFVYLVSTISPTVQAASIITQNVFSSLQWPFVVQESPDPGLAADYLERLHNAQKEVEGMQLETVTDDINASEVQKISMSFLYQLKLFAAYAASAYCMSWNIYPVYKCGYPRCTDNEITLRSLIGEGVTLLNGSNITSSLLDADILAATEPKQYLYSSKSHLVGLISTNNFLEHISFSQHLPTCTKTSIIISFRGSLHPDNFVSDLKFFPRNFQYPNGPEGARIHTGFWSIWVDMETQVVEGVERIMASSDLTKHRHFEIIITGHSMGGAVGILCALELRKRAFEGRFGVLGDLLEIRGEVYRFSKASVSFRSYTFGQPRVGNEIFSNWLKNLDGFPVFRTTYYSDAVVHLPPRSLPLLGNKLGFYHHASEFFIRRDKHETVVCDSVEDPKCSVGVKFVDIFSHLTYWNILFGPWC